MATAKVVFRITAQQLDALRGVAEDPTKDLFSNASRDPRLGLVDKGLLKHDPAGGAYSYNRFQLTDFGRAILAGLKDVKTERRR
jgi:hypothetical protein